MIGHCLKQWPAEFAHRFLWHLGQFLAVAQDDETADASFRIGPGFQ